MHTDGDRRKGDAIDSEDSKEKRDNPGWADGLRQLYDSVVEEPLPDSFKELLSKLDDKS
ncbi:MAG: NepR family anti-sigma factor [Pseudomonadota bacterium]|nr:NepR family anti-sigma factor [Pseudomonadota bacterium]